MRIRYIIKGTVRIDDMVRMTLGKEELVKKKDDFDPMSMVGNFQGLTQKLQSHAMLMAQPDMITIPYEEWKKHEYKIDDIIVVDIEGEV